MTRIYINTEYFDEQVKTYHRIMGRETEIHEKQIEEVCRLNRVYANGLERFSQALDLPISAYLNARRLNLSDDTVPFSSTEMTGFYRTGISGDLASRWAQHWLDLLVKNKAELLITTFMTRFATSFLISPLMQIAKEPSDQDLAQVLYGAVEKYCLAWNETVSEMLQEKMGADLSHEVEAICLAFKLEGEPALPENWEFEKFDQYQFN